MRAMQSMASKLSRTARSAVCTNAVAMRSMPLASSACGGGPSGLKGTAEGATVGQASSAVVNGLPPSHGRCDEASPVWPIWIAKRCPRRRHRRADARGKRRLVGVGVEAEAAVPDASMPSMAVASSTTIPARDMASCIRCGRCQLVAQPSAAEYSMGATATRLGTSIGPTASGARTDTVEPCDGESRRAAPQMATQSASGRPLPPCPRTSRKIVGCNRRSAVLHRAAAAHAPPRAHVSMRWRSLHPTALRRRRRPWEDYRRWPRLQLLPAAGREGAELQTRAGPASDSRVPRAMARVRCASARARSGASPPTSSPTVASPRP